MKEVLHIHKYIFVFLYCLTISHNTHNILPDNGIKIAGKRPDILLAA